MCLQQRHERGDVGRVNAHAGRDGRVEPKVWLGLGLGSGSGLGLRPGLGLGLGLELGLEVGLLRTQGLRGNRWVGFWVWGGKRRACRPTLCLSKAYIGRRWPGVGPAVCGARRKKGKGLGLGLGSGSRPGPG